MPMERFFKSNRIYAVAGASNNTSKFGYKVFQWYLDHKIPAIPINPKDQLISGVSTVTSLKEASIPSGYDIAISVVTPPAVTKKLIESLESLHGKVSSLWLQPGTYNEDVLKLARQRVPDVITDCILVNGDKYYMRSQL